MKNSIKDSITGTNFDNLFQYKNVDKESLSNEFDGSNNVKKKVMSGNFSSSNKEQRINNKEIKEELINNEESV